MANTKVYLVMSHIPADDYGCGGESYVCSAHRTEETAALVCQTRHIEQLEYQLEAVRKEPHYKPELRHTWSVHEHILKD